MLSLPALIGLWMLIGIATKTSILLADYAHSLCEEAGAESLAWCTALAGRVLVLAAAWPLLEEIGQKIGSIAG